MTRPAPDIAKDLRGYVPTNARAIVWLRSELLREAADALEQMHEALAEIAAGGMEADAYVEIAHGVLGGGGMGSLWY